MANADPGADARKRAARTCPHCQQVFPTPHGRVAHVRDVHERRAYRNPEKHNDIAEGTAPAGRADHQPAPAACHQHRESAHQPVTAAPVPDYLDGINMRLGVSLMDAAAMTFTEAAKAHDRDATGFALIMIGLRYWIQILAYSDAAATRQLLSAFVDLSVGGTADQVNAADQRRQQLVERLRSIMAQEATHVGRA